MTASTGTDRSLTDIIDALCDQTGTKIVGVTLGRYRTESELKTLLYGLAVVVQETRAQMVAAIKDNTSWLEETRRLSERMAELDFRFRVRQDEIDVAEETQKLTDLETRDNLTPREQFFRDKLDNVRGLLAGTLHELGEEACDASGGPLEIVELAKEVQRHAKQRHERLSRVAGRMAADVVTSLGGPDPDQEQHAADEIRADELIEQQRKLIVQLTSTIDRARRVIAQTNVPGCEMRHDLATAAHNLYRAWQADRADMATLAGYREDLDATKCQVSNLNLVIEGIVKQVAPVVPEVDRNCGVARLVHVVIERVTEQAKETDRINAMLGGYRGGGERMSEAVERLRGERRAARAQINAAIREDTLGAQPVFLEQSSDDALQDLIGRFKNRCEEVTELLRADADAREALRGFANDGESVTSAIHRLQNVRLLAKGNSDRVEQLEKQLERSEKKVELVQMFTAEWEKRS